MTSTSTTIGSPTRTTPIDSLTRAALVGGPALLVASTVAWLADAPEPRAILSMWAFVGFGLAVVGLVRRLDDGPLTAALLGLGLLGSAGGVAFSTEIAFVDHFGIERLNDAETAATFLLLRIPGIAFPTSLLLAAALLGRRHLVSTPHAAALALGAVCFPASRIPELPGLALVADLLLLAAIGAMAMRVPDTDRAHPRNDR